MINADTVTCLYDDHRFKEEMIAWLNQTIDDEIHSEKEEIDCTMIEACTELLLRLQEEDGDTAAMLVPLMPVNTLIRKAQYRGYYSLSKTMRALLIAAIMMSLLAAVNTAIAAATGFNPAEELSSLVVQVFNGDDDLKEDVAVTEEEPPAAPPEHPAEITTEATATEAVSATAAAATSGKTNGNPPVAPKKAAPPADTHTTTAAAPEEDATPVALRLTFDKRFKTEYLWGEALCTDGLHITLVMDDGTEKSVLPADCRITGYNKNKVGKQTVQVSCQGLSASFDITLRKAAPAEKAVTGVEGTAPKKTVYTTDDTRLQLSGLKVRLIYSDGSVSQWYSFYDAKPVNTVDFSKTGEQQVVLRIADAADFTYTIFIEPAYEEPSSEPASEPVTEPTSESSTEPSTEPSTESTTVFDDSEKELIGFTLETSWYHFSVGDPIEAGNILIIAYYTDGTMATLPYNAQQFTADIDTSKPRGYTIFHLTYRNYTNWAQYYVTDDTPTEPEQPTEPDPPKPVKLSYIEPDTESGEELYEFCVGDTPESADFSIMAYYSDGNIETLYYCDHADEIKIYNLDTSKEGSGTMTVSYQGKRFTCRYFVKKRAEGVRYAEFVGQPKFLYYQGEALGYGCSGTDFEAYTSFNATYGNSQMKTYYRNLIVGSLSLNVAYTNGQYKTYYGSDLVFRGYHPEQLGYQKISVYDRNGFYLLSYLVFVYGDEGYCPLFRTDYACTLSGTEHIRQWAKCTGNGNLKSYSNYCDIDYGDADLGAVREGSVTLTNGTSYTFETQYVREIQSARLTEYTLIRLNPDEPEHYDFGDTGMVITYIDGTTETIPLNEMQQYIEIFNDGRSNSGTVGSAFGLCYFSLDNTKYIGQAQLYDFYARANLLLMRPGDEDTITLSIYGNTEGIEDTLVYPTSYTEKQFTSRVSSFELNATDNSVQADGVTVSGVEWGTPGTYDAVITVTYRNAPFVFYKTIQITE